MSQYKSLLTPAARRLGLLALGLATLLPMLGGSLASMVLPALEQAFAVPFASLQWVLVAYLLGITCLTVVAGRLGDRFGRRRLLLLGLGLFALASLLCALAPTIGWLIAARVLQGGAAACMLSLALAMVGQLVPAARRGWCMGLLGTLSACGTALGPSFGGLLTAGFGWQAPFLLLVPLSLLALGCAWLGLPWDSSSPQKEGMNLTSLSLLVAALLCYGLTLTLGGSLALWWGVGALLVTASFVRLERNAPVPLLPLALLGAPGLRNGLVASALVASVMVLTLLIGPFYLRGVFGLDLGTVGLMISGGPLLAALTGMPAGWLVDRLGARQVIRLGLSVMGAAALGLVGAAGQFGPLGYLLPILLLTAGYALFQTANNSAVVGAASEQTKGAVAGLLTLSRNLGQLTGVAGLGGLFAALVGEQGLTLASELVFGARALFTLSALLIGLALWLVGRRRKGGLASA
ncbi:MFS transporter [Aeromonas sp. YN13HZO-058]|uniref:MFS transporter n=1 Tax=Aeromonas sp. YN13HZO-058 TaxID=1921564 RepID=UPI000946C42A|nr:MFS transporter [Aeromonas sp. YN13HZO-058]OLF20827.1 MFS transporter [Aeromonas sp. YN13HZO-058]